MGKVLHLDNFRKQKPAGTQQHLLVITATYKHEVGMWPPIEDKIRTIMTEPKASLSRKRWKIRCLVSTALSPHQPLPTALLEAQARVLFDMIGYDEVFSRLEAITERALQEKPSDYQVLVLLAEMLLRNEPYFDGYNV